jgi:hypothetical protein
MVRTEHSTSQEKAPARRGTLSALEKTTAVALFLNAVIFLFLFFFVWLVVGPFVLPYLIFSMVTTLVAGLILTRMRLAPLLGVLVVLITSSLTIAETATSSALIHPTSWFSTLAFAICDGDEWSCGGHAGDCDYRGRESGRSRGEYRLE